MVKSAHYHQAPIRFHHPILANSSSQSFIPNLSSFSRCAYFSSQTKIEYIMEEPLQKLSNEHRTLYYSSQLKVMDISQNIRAFGTKFTINEIKTVTLEFFNLFCMLQKIFEEAGLKHIYQLTKTINQNYNSLIAILLEREPKITQKFAPKCSKSDKQEEKGITKVQDVFAGETNLMREIKKNRLGGIHLFNENYARYLEDHRVMDQIRMQKGKRLHRNRLQILRQSIFEELDHKTDVEQSPAKNDEITNYIIKSKDKNSIYNYVSYEPQLQQILAFFQNSQSEANDFLVRKVGKVSNQDGAFSFSDFQRDIQMKNYTFKKQIIQKFKEFIQKYRKKQEEMERYLNEKQVYFKALQQKYFKMPETSTQTDLNIDDYLKNHEQKLKDIQLKCKALENMKKQQMNNNQREGQLIHELAIRENHIEKLNYRLAQQQSAIEYVKKLLRQQKTKKSHSIKEEPPKSQNDIQQSIQKQKQKRVVQISQSNDIVQAANQQIVYLNSTTQVRKTSYLSNTWRRKQSNDGLSLMSFNQLDRDSRDHDQIRIQKKKYVRYHIDSKYTDSDKSQYYAKPKTTQSTQIHVQTDFKPQEYLEKYSLRETHEKLPVLAQENQEDKKSNKKGKLTPSSTPKTSSKNVDFSLHKSSNEKLSDASKRLKQRKNITSLTKIKSVQDLSQVQGQARRRSSKERKSKKSASRQAKKSIKEEKPFKRQQVNLDKLDFNKQQKEQDIEQQQKIQGHSQASALKDTEKRDQTAYKIFEVVEQQDEERQTIKNTERSEKMSSIYSHKRLQFDLMDKLNRELNKIKLERHCTFEHVYDLTILPYQKHKCTRSGNDFKISHNSHNKYDRASFEATDPLAFEVTKGTTDLNDLDINNMLKIKSKEQNKPFLALDDLIKSIGPQNPIKTQKLKNWKKRMMNMMKSDTFSQQEAEQILSVIRQSTKCKENGIKTQQASHLSSASNHIRNSLPEIDVAFEGKSIKKATGCLRKIKLKTSSEDTQDINIKIDKFQEKLASGLQQKIEELIQLQALQPYFKERFASLHRKCQQGTICSHINKYFETIMKHYEQRKKKGKQTLVLPIEHIGNRNDVQQNTQKQNKQSPRKNDHKEHPLQKDSSYSKGKSIGLTRQRLSQQSLLPNIKDYKLSKTSKAVY